MSHSRLRLISPAVALISLLLGSSTALASTPGADVRLTHDNVPTTGYVSADAIAGVSTYTDATLQECSRSRGRQNEPSVAIDPRNKEVVIGSSNDYCAVYNNGDDADGAPIPVGPIWLGYYRSENGGSSFVSSLVPGYPGDTSTLGALAKIRTASAGDPVIAWDAEGRVFMGSESSDDPAGSKKTFGDVWVGRYVNPAGPTGDPQNDGKQFAGSVIVAKGTSAPNLLGKFNDKTSIEADRTTTSCQGNVYFAWSAFYGNGRNAIWLSRSTDHGATFSQPTKLSEGVHDVQFPDISVTSNGHVFLTFRQFAAGAQQDAVDIVKSTNCGATFTKPKVITTINPMGLTDVSVSGGRARDCGDGPSACQSGYTFFRADTGPRSTSDQAASGEWIHVAYEAIVPGTEVSTGTTFGWADAPGAGGQSAIYYLRYNGSNGNSTTPQIIANSTGQQLFPDLAVDNGTIHALFYDSRNDLNNTTPATARIRPIGNNAAGDVVPGFDVYATTKPANSGSWSSAVRLTDVTSNGQYEQFGGRTVPFGGDYLWIDSKGGLTFGVWTDWRDTVPGTDPRYPDGDGADVLQCRDPQGTGFTGDKCPRNGGMDQNIYGDLAP